MAAQVASDGARRNPLAEAEIALPSRGPSRGSPEQGGVMAVLEEAQRLGERDLEEREEEVDPRWMWMALDRAHREMQERMRPQDVRQRVSETLRGRVNSTEMGLYEELMRIREDIARINAESARQAHGLWREVQSHSQELKALAEVRNIVMRQVENSSPKKRRGSSVLDSNSQASGQPNTSIPNDVKEHIDPNLLYGPPPPSFSQLVEMQLDTQFGARFEGFQEEMEEFKKDLEKEVHRIGQEYKDDAVALSQQMNQRLEDLGDLAQEARTAASAAGSTGARSNSQQAPVTPYGALKTAGALGAGFAGSKEPMSARDIRPPASGGSSFAGHLESRRSSGATTPQSYAVRLFPTHDDTRPHTVGSTGTTRPCSRRWESPFPARGEQRRGWHW